MYTREDKDFNIVDDITVDLSKCPVKTFNFASIQPCTIVYGSLHGNLLKLIHLLMRLGIIAQNESLYNEFRKLTFLPQPFDVKCFSSYLYKILHHHKSIDPNIRLILIGDILNTDINQSRFILLVLLCLMDNHVEFKIVISSNDLIILHQILTSEDQTLQLLARKVYIANCSLFIIIRTRQLLCCYSYQPTTFATLIIAQKSKQLNPKALPLNPSKHSILNLVEGINTTVRQGLVNRSMFVSLAAKPKARVEENDLFYLSRYANIDVSGQPDWWINFCNQPITPDCREIQTIYTEIDSSTVRLCIVFPLSDTKELARQPQRLDEIRALEQIGEGWQRNVYFDRNNKFGNRIPTIYKVYKPQHTRKYSKAEEIDDLRLNSIYENIFEGRYKHYSCFKALNIEGKLVIQGPFIDGIALKDNIRPSFHKTVEPIPDEDKIPRETVTELTNYGYIPLDLKPSNFIRTPEGHVIPIDAKFIGRKRSNSLRSKQVRDIGNWYDSRYIE